MKTNSEMIIKIISFLCPVITFIGLITNTFTLAIFSRKKFRKTIFSTYFRFYVAIQTLNLIMPINKFLEWNFDIFFSLFTDFTCKLTFYYSNTNHAIAGWLLMIISFDRYLSIVYPAKLFIFRKKSKIQISICIAIIGYHLCVYSPYWFRYLKEIQTHSNKTNETQIKSVFWFTSIS